MIKARKVYHSLGKKVHFSGIMGVMLFLRNSFAMREPLIWAIVPAAGNGQRFGTATPKQYQDILGKPVIDYAIAPLVASKEINRVVVVLAPEDKLWKRSSFVTHPKVLVTRGSDDRQDSVLNGLNALREKAQDNDWVLVHDAARPCLQLTDIQQLIRECSLDDVGGLLATPVTDTVKRSASNQRVMQTVSREKLWRALTPQMFRYELLVSALRHANNEDIIVTDEAMAIEMLGLSPKIVTGRFDNIKVTYPEDLKLAEHYLGGIQNPVSVL